MAYFQDARLQRRVFPSECWRDRGKSAQGFRQMLECVGIVPKYLRMVTVYSKRMLQAKRRNLVA
jgi:hypothetical protein